MDKGGFFLTREREGCWLYGFVCLKESQSDFKYEDRLIVLAHL